MARAVEAGWSVLAQRGGALEAAVEAVVVLEDDPHFNAGLGSTLTADGGVEMDASVMTGDTLAAGAVGAVAGVPNPIRLARAVLAEGREVLLVGEPAVALARRHGLPLCPPEDLVTEAARRHWSAPQGGLEGTVGAVACDGRGHVAAATSTGGLSGKRRG
ncbi:MAG: isoaspartyl peptidase/L-asparaginase, partial [Deltaproteobacteria bacterium]